MVESQLLANGWLNRNFRYYFSGKFTAWILLINLNIKTKKTMSRQNRNSVRDRKTEESKRDVANSNERYSRQNREALRSDDQDRNEMNSINGLDRYRLNDLYERSSI